jgi:hypothetical protein
MLTVVPTTYETLDSPNPNERYLCLLRVNGRRIDINFYGPEREPLIERALNWHKAEVERQMAKRGGQKAVVRAGDAADPVERDETVEEVAEIAAAPEPATEAEPEVVAEPQTESVAEAAPEPTPEPVIETQVAPAPAPKVKRAAVEKVWVKNKRSGVRRRVTLDEVKGLKDFGFVLERA